MDVPLGLQTPLNSGLYLKAVLLEETKLLHQRILFEDEALVIAGEFLSVLAAHLQLCFELSDLLGKLVPLKVIPRGLFNGLLLGLSGVLEGALDVVQLHELALVGELLSFTLK